MWRAIHSIGRGLRSVRPSQCCPQDCCEEGSHNYHTHSHQQHDEVSEVQAATLRHYATVLHWNPLTIRRNLGLLRGSECNSNHTVCNTQTPFWKVEEGIHTGPVDNGSSRQENITSVYRKCPPWHWQLLQNHEGREKCDSEKAEGSQEEQNTRTAGETYFYQEWKAILQASPTLQALYWGSAAALTWSLYRGWNEYHPCLYQKKGEQQALGDISRKSDSDNLVAQEDHDGVLQNFHEPFKDFYDPFQSNSSDPSFDKNYDKPNLPETYGTLNLELNFKPSLLCGPNDEECQAQTTVVPLYSLPSSFNGSRNIPGIQGCYQGREDHITEEYHRDLEFDGVSELSSSYESDLCNALETTDSGCISDLNLNSQSKSCTSIQDVNSQYKQKEESNVIKITSSVTSPESTVTEVQEPEVRVDEKDDDEHYQTTIHDDLTNDFCDTNTKTLHGKLLEIVKAHHEERFLGVLEEENALRNTEPEDMVVYFQAGVLAGDINALFNLAQCYHTGRGVVQDLEKARKLYETCSAAGHGWATYNLAVMMSHGLGGPTLSEKALDLLKQAAEKGVKEAKEALSILEEEKQRHAAAPKVEEDEPHLRRCYSEPCLFSALQREWLSSYSTGDLHSLLDEDDWIASDLSTHMDGSDLNVRVF